MRALLVLLLCACVDGTYHCAEDSQCIQRGPSGRCETTAFCSFPDSTCVQSGYRYSSFAGDGLAGTCAPPHPDAGADDGGGP
jgi:hypothetical protein